MDHSLQRRGVNGWRTAVKARGGAEGRGNTEAQKTSSVGAGRGGILGYRVYFSKKHLIQRRDSTCGPEASRLSMGIYVQLKTYGSVCASVHGHYECV